MESLNICDYSLLVGFHFGEAPIPRSGTYRNSSNCYSHVEGRPQPTSLFREYAGGLISRDDRNYEQSTEIYFLGIIDILTTYDFKKRSEHVFKSLIHDSVWSLSRSPSDLTI